MMIRKKIFKSLLISILLTGCAKDDWTTFGNNLKNNNISYVNVKIPLNINNVIQLDGPIASRILKKDDKIFVMAGSTAVCLNENTLEKIWDYKFSSSIITTPSISSKLIVIGTTDGSISAHNYKDGKFKWRFSAYAPITTNILYDNGLWFIPSEDNNVYAIDNNGIKKWKEKLETNVTGLALNKESLYPITLKGTLRKFKTKTGEKEDEFSSATLVKSVPVITEYGIIITGYLSTLILIDETNFTKINEVTIGSRIISSVSSIGNLCYVGTLDGQVICYEIPDFKIKWRQMFNIPFSSSPVITKNCLILVSSNGVIFALDKQNGSTLWQGKIAGNVFNGVLVTKKGIYIGTSEGKLFYLN